MQFFLEYLNVQRHDSHPSTQNLLLTVLLGVLLVGGAWYYVEKKSEEPATDDEASVEKEVEEPNEPEPNLAGYNSFGYLMALNRDLACDFSYTAPDTDGAVAGTVYISDENIRADFEMEQAGEIYRSHLIQNNEEVYTWTESSLGTFAFVSPIAEEGTTGSDTSQPDRSLDMSQTVDYDCQPWSWDGSLFVPPGDIDFLSPEEVLDNAGF